MFENKGQGSLEYLLILGGAILVAVIIIAAVVSLGQGNGGTTVKRNTLEGICNAQVNQTNCEVVTLDGVAPPTGETTCVYDSATTPNCTANTGNTYS